jgi:hypothetical protein
MCTRQSRERDQFSRPDQTAATAARGLHIYLTVEIDDSESVQSDTLAVLYDEHCIPLFSISGFL